MFKKILIANRGEIALRILRACKELNIKTVAIHSEADESAIHVKMADESICVGPASAQLSYLNIPAIVTAATLTNADAIHPGYGFLSESKRFAEIIEEHKIKFIGPTSKHIGIMGDKIKARRIMRDNGVPIVPGLHDVNDINQVNKFIDEIGLPIIIKAASGGGGKGMRIVKKNNELKNALGSAKIEAKKSFNNDILYIEKFISTPKHIEIQILADAHGNVLTLGERDCSIQRKHQKLIEECPSLCLEENERQEISELCRKAMMSIGYEGVGTLEFLYDNKKFYFMEMNTRLQVEHPITEMVTQIDLVKEQIFAALGEKITKKQDDILLKGHAIECRINAEDPKTFMPSPGKIDLWHPPGGPGIRVDSHIYTGYEIPPYYDSMIAKVIAYANSRESAITRMGIALSEMIVEGIKTNRDLQIEIMQHNAFKEGGTNIHYLEKRLGL